MPSRIKMESKSATALSRTSSMDQNPLSRHTSNLRDSTLPTGITKVEDVSNQDGFSFSSGLHNSSHTHDLDHWSLNTSDSLASSPIPFIAPESAETTMLSYPLPHSSFLASSMAESNSMFSALSDLHSMHAPGEIGDTDYGQDYQNFASMIDFGYDNDSCTSESTRARDLSSLDQNHGAEDHRLITALEAWNSISIESNSISGSTFESLSTNALCPPASPPLTDASHVSLASAGSHIPFGFQGHEDSLMVDKINPTNWPTNSNNFGDSFPLTPPLNDQDPNRTIRASKQTQRSLVPISNPRPPRKSDPELYVSLPVREPLRQRTKENSEIRSPRDHPYYSLPTHSDGKYYCPFASGDKPCSHPPTTQKCAYHKYLDSHLKPYRCKVHTCMDAQLHFSSNACLFRHEREAHGFHGHGDNPHLCLFEGCDRAIPGNGFPRRWNLYDHMKRVHDYTASESSGSPEDASAPTASPTSSKKDSTTRKRKVTRPISGSQTMKRTRSTQSASATTSKPTGSSNNSTQKLKIAERNYLVCRTRLLEELGNIIPQDAGLHDKANASLQELITLGLHYRRIEAGSAAAQLSNGVAD